MWYGISRFEKAIPKAANPMYGFRLRQGNIQLVIIQLLLNFLKKIGAIAIL